MPIRPTKITLPADIEGAHLHVGYGPTEPIKLLLAMEQTSAGTRAVCATRCRAKADPRAILTLAAMLFRLQRSRRRHRQGAGIA